MANRYWVGGTGSWLDPNRWSQTSGGPPGWPPLSNSTIIFDSNSSAGSYTVNDMPTSLVCDGIFISNPSSGTVSFATFSTLLTLTGSYTISAGVTIPTGRNLTFTVPAVTTASISTNGIAHGNIVLSSAAGNGNVQQASALTCTSLTLNQGGWLTQNYALTTSGNIVAQPAPSIFVQLALGSSVVTVNGLIDFSSVLGTLSFSAGTSTIYLNRNSSDYVLKASGQTFNTLWKDQSSGRFSGSFTANTLFLREGNFTFDGPMTVTTQNLSLINRSSDVYLGRSTARSTSVTNNVTFSASSTFFLRGINLERVTYSGVAPSSPASVGDLGGNVGLSSYMDAPQNCYWVPTADNLFASEKYWSNTSGGAIDTALYPLPQHTMVYDNNSAYKLTVSGVPQIGSLNTSARTTAGSVVMGGGEVFGNFAFGNPISGFASVGGTITFANKAVAQTLSSSSLNPIGLRTGNTTTVIDKGSQTLTILGDCVLGRVSHLSGTVSTTKDLQTLGWIMSSTAVLNASGMISMNSTTSPLWSAPVGCSYNPGATGHLWAYTGASGLTLALELGNLSYNKIAINNTNTYVLNVANNPYIGLLTNVVSILPYPIPTNVTFSGAGTVTIGQWDLNGSSTTVRQAVTGAGGAQISTDVYYPIQANFLSLTNLPTPLTNKFYAAGSLDNGGNTNWVFGTAPPRSSGFMLFF